MPNLVPISLEAMVVSKETLYVCRSCGVLCRFGGIEVVERACPLCALRESPPLSNPTARAAQQYRDDKRRRL